jgi:hypothetical protein
MSKVNFDVVWRKARKDRKKFSCYLLKKFKQKFPELAERAMELNRIDEFVMYDEA